MAALEGNYNHKTREKHWQQHWLDAGTYHWDESESRANTYVIDTPPPTVSGTLHMGHIFSYTQADFIARFQRMNGKTVFYPMGFDDNGLPTERLVEKVKKVRATDMSREAFIELCQGVAEEARIEFRTLFSSTALSVDWRQEYSTISVDSRRISQMSFLDLFKKERAYRKLQPMLWDPVDQTAIAQAEVEDKELPSHFSDILFEVASEPSSSGRGQGEGYAYNSEEMLEFARELRKNSTDVEKIMWQFLRGRQLLGVKFRRQHPIESYVVDFLSHEAKLIIELDGGQHNEEAELKRDAKRTEFFESKGFKVLRFWNNQVLENFEGVAQTIYNALTSHSALTLTLSQREREFIVIGTTRPEMIPACVAIFYHPDDARYQHLKGKFAITPLFGVRVPILEDDTVEPEKGTGIMMCCTFGDEKDIEKWRKHELKTRIILNKYGRLDFHCDDIENNTDCFSIDFDASNSRGYSGELFQFPECGNQFLNQLHKKKVSNADVKNLGARETILHMLAQSGDLVESKPIVHAVKCAERSGAPLEILPTQQWFVKLLDQKEQLKAKAAECNWHPEYMKIRMDQWIDGLSWDWCISRQRYFGVPFPVWYSKRAGEEGKILIADADQLPVNPLVDLPKGYARDEVEAEADVMDTWATSSVSPQLSSKGISSEFAVDAKRHTQLFPADLRPQAHEIIRTWAFYTLVKAHLHEDSIPWKNLMISGWCLAADKTKMSKSKGNVVTPVALIEEKGTDAVRYWASTSRLGCDTAFSEDLLKIGNKLVNKIWNASKFASMQLAHLKGTPTTATADINAGIITETLDKWIISRLHKAIAKATVNFSEYEYCDARVAAEDFFWNDFCDNYLELVKARAYGQFGEAAQQSACTTIYHCLDAILRLFAPFVPHITEEVFSVMFEEKCAASGSLHARGMWAKADDYTLDDVAEKTGIATVVLLELVRKAKSERNVSIKVPLAQMVVSHAADVDADVWAALPSVADDLKSATSALELVFAVDEAADEIVMRTDDDAFSVAMRLAPQENVA